MEYAIFAMLSKNLVVALVSFGVTGPILIRFAQNVAKILPLYVFELKCRYCNLFWNAAVPYERLYPTFSLKLIAMAMSLEEFEKEVQINHA